MRDRIKERRKTLGYSQQELADISGIERCRCSRIESGAAKTVSIEEAYKIASALNTTVDDLFCPGVCKKITRKVRKANAS